MRLALLTGMAASGAIAVHATLWSWYTERWPALERCHDRPQLRGGAEGAFDLLSAGNVDAAWRDAFACQAAAADGLLWWLGGGVAALLTVTVLLYFLQPWWRIRRSGLVELGPVDGPELWAELDRLVGEASVRYRPRFLVDPVNLHTGGLAFGRGRHPLIRLDAGLITQFRRDPAAFRIVVRHELAHLSNRDVSLTYLALAIWRAFLVTAVLPFVVTGLASGLDEVAVDTGRFLPSAALAGLVYLTRNAVLRLREHHADLTVSGLLGSTDPDSCLPALSADNRGSRGGRGGLANSSRLPTPLRKHPAPAARAAVIAAPASVHRPGFWEHVAAGAALQAGVQQVGLVLLLLGATNMTSVMMALWGVGIALALVVAVRRAHDFLVAGAPGTGRWLLAPTGAGLAVGVFAGHDVNVLFFRGSYLDPVAVAGALVLMAALVLLGEWGLATWSTVVASRTGMSRAVGAVAVVVTLLVLCVSALSFGSVLQALPGYVTGFRITLEPLHVLVENAGWTALDWPLVAWVWTPFLFTPTVVGVLGLAGSVLLWAVPLVAARRRGDRHALLVGLLGVLGWLAFSLALRAIIRADVPMATRDTDGFRLVLSAWEITGVFVAQIAVCAVVSHRNRGAAPWRTLFAGAVTGLGGGAALWLFFVIDACVPILRAAKTGCPASVNTGYGANMLCILMAGNLVASLLGYGLAASLRMARSGRSAVGERGGPWFGPRLGHGRTAAVVAVVCLTLLALPGRVSSGDGPMERAGAEARTTAPDNPRKLAHWLRADGQRLIDTVLDPYIVLNEAQKSRTVEVAEILAELERALSAIERVREEPGPPGKQAHRLWSEWLSGTERATRLMLSALRAGDEALLSESSRKLDRSTDSLEALYALSR